MNAIKYTAVLETKILSSDRKFIAGENWMFWDDNALGHWTKLVVKWMEIQTVKRTNTISIPAQSLNPCTI